MNNIEDAIKRCKEIINKCDDCKFATCEQCEINWTDIQAIKIVLGNLEALCDMQKSADRELENAEKINEEHRKENADLMKAINVVEKEKGEWIEDCNNLKKKVKELEEDLYSTNKIINEYLDDIPNQREKEMQAKIKELEAKLEFKKYGDLDEIEFEEYMSHFIPKQKVKDKIEEVKLSGGGNGKDNVENLARELVIDVLEELLEEGE